MPNDGLGSRTGGGRYKQKMYALDPSYAERLVIIHNLTESVLGVRLKEMDMFTVMVTCVEVCLLNPTLVLEIDRKNKTPPSLQTKVRMDTVKRLIEAFIANKNASPDETIDSMDARRNDRKDLPPLVS